MYDAMRFWLDRVAWPGFELMRYRVCLKIRIEHGRPDSAREKNAYGDPNIAHKYTDNLPGKFMKCCAK